MNKQNGLICFLFSLLLVILSSCHRKPEPCPGTVTNTSADFIVAQTISAGDIDLECDTCLQGWIKFSLKDKSAETVQWKIGTDPNTFTQKSFSLYFEDSILVLPITCMVKKKPDLKCFPYDDGVDTITKIISIRDFYNRLYYGTFRGCNEDNPSHYFDIKLVMKDTIDKVSNGGEYYANCGPEDYVEFTVHNLPEGEETKNLCYLPTFVYGSYRSFYIDGKDASLGPLKDNLLMNGKGYLEIGNNNKIVIEYSYVPDLTSMTRIHKKFIGYRK